MQNKRSLSLEQKKIISEVNQLHFQNFKQHKKSFYTSLMKCGLNMANHQQYYQCTDAIQAAQLKAEQKMKAELIDFEKVYESKLQICGVNNNQCVLQAQNEMRKNIYKIFQKFYGNSFNE